MSEKRLLVYDIGVSTVSAEYHLGVLLDKVINSGRMTSIFSYDNVLLRTLDAKLWTFSPNYFIPHTIFENGLKIEDYHVLLFSDLGQIVSRDMFCFIGDCRSFCEFLKKDFTSIIDKFSDFVFVGRVDNNFSYNLEGVNVVKFVNDGKSWVRVVV
jgi:DNA polymerase IIIc chi subunit